MNTVLDLTQRFLKRIEEQEKTSKSRILSKDLTEELLHSLRSVRRKEMKVRVTYYEELGRQVPEFVTSAEYFFCKACLIQFNFSSSINWIDVGDVELLGPLCGNCAHRELKACHHEDGMTHGSSRMYSLQSSAELLEALAVYMAHLPEEEPVRGVRDPVTSLLEAEQSDFDDLVF
jgi:hypothetical protein